MILITQSPGRLLITRIVLDNHRRQKFRPSPQEHGGRGVWGNSAVFLQKIEASPAALLFKARHHRKILFSLREEKIRRAQNEKGKEYFSVARRALASGGGAASFVGVRLVKSSDFVQDRQPRYSPAKAAVLSLGMLMPLLNVQSCGAWNRTKILSFKGSCPTIRRPRSFGHKLFFKFTAPRSILQFPFFFTRLR